MYDIYFGVDGKEYDCDSWSFLQSHLHLYCVCCQILFHAKKCFGENVVTKFTELFTIMGTSIRQVEDHIGVITIPCMSCTHRNGTSTCMLPVVIIPKLFSHLPQATPIIFLVNKNHYLMLIFAFISRLPKGHSALSS